MSQERLVGLREHGGCTRATQLSPRGLPRHLPSTSPPQDEGDIGPPEPVLPGGASEC